MECILSTLFNKFIMVMPGNLNCWYTFSIGLDTSPAWSKGWPYGGFFG